MGKNDGSAKLMSGQVQKLLDRVHELESEKKSQQKSIKSYESAIKTLTDNWKEDKRERKARHKIIETYLEQEKDDNRI